MHQGDWMCQCGEHNFKDRKICRKCNKIKPSQSIQQKPGDWNCSCGELNFAKNIICRKCKKENPNKKIIVPKEGDWDCSCGELNFRFRDICRKCNKLKINKNTQDENSVPKCVICITEAKTIAIKVCGHYCYCENCGYAINKCPICRAPYNPDTDLIRIYDS